MNHDPSARKAYYLDHFRKNRAAILAAAAKGFDPPVKGCPGWDVAGLTAHMGRVFTFWGKWVSERPRGHSREAFEEILADRNRRLAGYNEWEKAGFPKDVRPAGIIEFARTTGDELDAALVSLDPAEYVWTFVPTRQTGAFVFRRLAMETAVHRWDAEQAYEEHPIDEELARDGVDEMLSMFQEDPGFGTPSEARTGQTVLLQQDAGPGRWLVTFGEDEIRVSHEEAAADVTVRGSCSDLLLFIMGRRTPNEMKVEGNAKIAAAWGDLAGRF